LVGAKVGFSGTNENGLMLLFFLFCQKWFVLIHNLWIFQFFTYIFFLIAKILLIWIQCSYQFSKVGVPLYVVSY